MLRTKTLGVVIFVFGLFTITTGYSQNETLLEPQLPPYGKVTPAHMWELGLHGGAALNWGDIDYMVTGGAGFHVRRAIDYVFSLRGEGLYTQLKNEDLEDGSTETDFQSASLQLVISANNLIWNANKNRKVNVYGLVGGGVNRFKVDVIKSISPALNPIDWTVQTHTDVGIGIAFRLADRFNLGFETKGMVMFGNDADRVDAIDRQDNDVVSYSSLRLNFNLGNKEKRAEPLYWVNPMDVILQDITELKKRPVFDPTDSDGDGVIDLVDQDNSTPPGVIVDTRGLPLDSDGDGIPNHEDDEPFMPKGKAAPLYQTDEPIATEADVERIVRERIDEYDRTGIVTDPGSSEKGGATTGTARPRRSRAGDLANWFMPIIHFNIDSYRIRPADFNHIAGIARLMKSDPDMKIVVTGFTDKTASADYNLELSYKRASAAIDYLVEKHGIDRNRFILNYNGEDLPLVPSANSSLMNRRVEFRAATESDMEMGKPSPISGNKNKSGF